MRGKETSREEALSLVRLYIVTLSNVPNIVTQYMYTVHVYYMDILTFRSSVGLGVKVDEHYWECVT